ncbi:MAG: thiamine pyrophosphate-dependent enzyme [Candidatus Paceibacterota bacterium]
MDDIILPKTNTWCPGCGNFAIQEALKKVVSEMDKENLVVVAGIGCHGKIYDHLNINSVYALHGRAIPLATGIKVGNPDLKVICNVGDGDSYNEGVSHLVHAAKRNSNITVIVHDNRVFALTVKQPTSTSPKGFVSSTSPDGSIEVPTNPLDVMMSYGATFVARGFSGKPDQLKRLITEGIEHKGFSFIEVLQPCVVWHNTYQAYHERCYEMEEEYMPYSKAKEKALEWDYNNDSNIPLGVFYQEEKPTFEEQLKEIHSVDIDKLMEDSK